MVLRLALLPVGGHGYDLPLMQQWAERLVNRPLPAFMPLVNWSSTIFQATFGSCGCSAT